MKHGKFYDAFINRDEERLGAFRFVECVGEDIARPVDADEIKRINANLSEWST